MIIEVRAKNCFIFDEQIAFSMKADMRNKKFATNVHQEGYFNILKTAGIYGPNNAGKTRLVKCIAAIKQILLDKDFDLMSNMFIDDSICELGVTFMESGKVYSYDIKYDDEKKEFLSERFSEVLRDQYGNEKEEILLLKDSISDKYYCLDEDVKSMMPMMSKKNLLCHLMDTKKFGHLDRIKCVLTSFADKIDIINMNNMALKHTIELLKNKNYIQQKIVDFVKNADLYMDNFEYADREKVGIHYDDEGIDEDLLRIREPFEDRIRLVSTYKGKMVQSMAFDSVGTKKIEALAGYIIEGLEQGRILVVDELDSSIHFKLTRAIVAMFNNELNADSQLIFTVHDINLMDCKRLFRKEQIWFVTKDDEGVYVYSLADFTAQQGVRDTTDIIEKYKKGLLGALPEPELIRTLMDIKGNTGGREQDE